MLISHTRLTSRRTLGLLLALLVIGIAALVWLYHDVLTLDAPDHSFVLDVTKEQLEKAQGFDKDHWPDFADESFHETTYGYWGRTPYWH